MAASASRAANSDLADRVSCSICMEQYDSFTRVPKILPCQHTFCLKCLLSMFHDQPQVVCPLCRTLMFIPAHGYITNLAVLNIVDAMQKTNAESVPTFAKLREASAGNALACPAHDHMECVLVCIDCLVGVCARCITHRSHHGHHLEEPSDAKTLLWPRFESRVRLEQAVLETKAAQARESPNSVANILEAEKTTIEIFNRLKGFLFLWGREQESTIRAIKNAAATRENTIEWHRGELQSLMEQNDVQIGTLIRKLSKPSISDMAFVSEQRELEPYNVAAKCQSLLVRVQSVLSEHISNTKSCPKQPVTDEPSQKGKSYEAAHTHQDAARPPSPKPLDRHKTMYKSSPDLRPMKTQLSAAVAPPVYADDEVVRSLAGGIAAGGREDGDTLDAEGARKSNPSTCPSDGPNATKKHTLAISKVIATNTALYCRITGTAKSGAIKSYIFIYDFETGVCQQCPQHRMKQAKQLLQERQDVQLDSDYEADIDVIRKSFSALLNHL